MTSTDIAPLIPLSKFKRTKIIATIGPATNSYEDVFNLIKTGANAIRMNFSHGNYEERDQQIKWIRKASDEYGKPVAIIQDLQGPKIRLGDFDGMISIEKGQELTLEYKARHLKSGHIPTQYDLSKKVKRGERLLMYDGKIQTEITSVKDGLVRVRALNKGIVTKRKGINLPDTNFKGDVLTDKDKKDIVYGANNDVDYVAMSFVQTAKDIENLRNLLDGHKSGAKIIAKIETNSAVENLDEIIDKSDAVMVARGDLAIETAIESVPVVTRRIIGKCLEYGKISIVATQMLATMTEASLPTRAEVSDVATAVIVGADAVMLSDETANGDYPIEAVKTMKNIILYTQDNAPLKPLFFKETDHTTQSSISSAIITLAHQVQAKAIVAETKSGATALSISAHRPVMPVIIVTSSPRTAQQMSIVYGGKTYIRPDDTHAARKLTKWLRESKVFEKDDIVVSASGRYPGKVGATDTIKVRKLE